VSAARATAAGHGNAFSAVARLHFKLLSLHLIPHRNDIQHIHRAIIIQVAAAGGGVGCGILAEAVAHRNQVEDVHLAVVIDVARRLSDHSLIACLWSTREHHRLITRTSTNMGRGVGFRAHRNPPRRSLKRSIPHRA